MYPLLQIFQIIFQSFSFRSIGDMNKIGCSEKSGANPANPEKYSIFQGFDGVMKSKFYHSMISLLADISHNNLSFPLSSIATPGDFYPQSYGSVIFASLFSWKST